MFLHAGASLHGHEYSNRSLSSNTPSPPFNAAPQRRNPLLRSALAASTLPRNRDRPVSIGPTIPFPEAALAQSASPTSPTLATRPTAAKSRARPVSDYIPRVRTDAITPSPEPTVRFKEPEHDYFHEPVTASTPSEAMSEDEASGVDVSESDASCAVSSTNRGPKRRRAPRKSTTFLLAQPAPKLRHKQRLMHIRPKLFLQMQYLPPDGRPRPIIDVYPSSAFAKTIVAPLLKRFPLISRIKSELSVQDVMLVRVKDYGTHVSESDSDGDDDNINSRDLIAVLSPLRTEDKAEIVLADGTVWVATPRPNGSYDFICVNASGKTITARWVRKQVVTNARSLPATPTSPIASPPKISATSSVDHKYTFSIIDPNSRRHPIMATLTNSSLDILDSYVTVSQSSNRYPPTSEDARTERTSQPVEEWQRTFISVSAIWVALRHGWAPNCRPTDLIPPTVLNSAASKRNSGSGSSNQDPATLKQSSMQEASNRGRRQLLLPIGRLHYHRPEEPQTSAPDPGFLPRRATSTGAAFMEKRRAMTRTNSDCITNSGRDAEVRACKASARRALSGDWEFKWRNHQQQHRENSLAAAVNGGGPADPSKSKVEGSGSTFAPASTPSTSAEPVPLDAKFQNSAAAAVLSDPLMDTVVDEPADTSDKRGRYHHHHKWRHIAAGWFRKLGGGPSSSPR